MNVRSLVAAALLSVVLVGGAVVLRIGFGAPSTPTPLVGPDVAAVLVGAGDIAGCEGGSDSETAALLDAIAGTVFTLGDNAYPSGSTENFEQCYAPTWGRHRHRTRPSLGNHDYGTDTADPYFAYFGDRAGPPGRGWYSYDAGAWHVVVLNSVCLDNPIHCEAGADQLGWLADDLRVHPSRCLLAYWHSPLISSGLEHGDAAWARPFWDALLAAGAEVVLNGDDHHYERFAPMDADGRASETGIRQFIVGTGGGGLRGLGTVKDSSEVQIVEQPGLLRLSLTTSGYEWRFLGTPDGRVLDEGSGTCR